MQGATETEVLYQFARHARQTRSVRDVVGAVMDCAPGIVGAAVVGCYRRTAAAFEIDHTGCVDALAGRYAEFTASSVDPIHAALVERHVAVRSNDLFEPDDWRRHPFCRSVEAEFGLEAYMAAELVDSTGVCGVVGVARMAGSLPFSVLDAQRLQAICLHVSVALTRIAVGDGARVDFPLTDKQRELVQLVANGLTNEQIARVLGKTSHAVKRSLERLFAKTSVASRAELVARVLTP
jgi:DNA-binding CsgD family transcriptional regulator